MTRRALASTFDVVLYLQWRFGVSVKPVTIRVWASRGHIGTHSRERERYDLREVEAYAKRRGIIPDRERTGDTHRKQGEHGPEG